MYYVHIYKTSIITLRERSYWMGRRIAHTHEVQRAQHLADFRYRVVSFLFYTYGYYFPRIFANRLPETTENKNIYRRGSIVVRTAFPRVVFSDSTVSRIKYLWEKKDFPQKKEKNTRSARQRITLRQVRKINGTQNTLFFAGVPRKNPFGRDSSLPWIRHWCRRICCTRVENACDAG